MSEVEELRNEIAGMEGLLAAKKMRLDNLERHCQHSWGETVYDPIRTEAYTAPGDPPGTMGVDWRGPVYVPAQTKDRWRRQCRSCGKTEFTYQSTEKTTKVPKF